MTSIAAYFRKLVGFQRDREKIGVRERLKLKHTFLYACSNGIIESVKECIDNGVDVNCKLGERERNYNYTFVPFPKHYKICLGDFGLMLATRQNHLDVCEILLSHPKINANNKDRKNRTALMESCRRGHSLITKLLIEVPNINLNCKGYGEGLNAVMEAIRCRRSENLDCLRILAHVENIDWNAKNFLGDNSIIWAVKCGNYESLDILREKSSIDWNAKNNDCGNWSSLEIALHLRNSELVQVLLSVPLIDINLEDRVYIFGYEKMPIVKYSELFLAKECRKFVSQLMSKDENYQPEEFVTELVYALRNNLDKVACILLASVSTVDILCLASNAVNYN